MAFPFTSTSPKFSITYVLGTTNTLTFTDLITTGYSSFTGYSAMKGLFQITDPDGIIVYQSTGFDLITPVWTSPDISTSGSVWSKTGVTLPLDSSGIVKRGIYIFEYLVSINGGTSFVRTIDSVTLRSKEYNFQYYPPEVVITYYIDYLAAELTSDDDTDTVVTISGVEYTPTSDVRAHLIKEPLGSGFSPTPGSTTDETRVIGGGSTSETQLWPGTWQTSITHTLVYSLATWNSYTWILINDVASGYKPIPVTSDNCGCVLSQCYTNLIQRWYDAEGGSKKNAWDLRVKAIAATAYWSEYQNARNCGEDTSIPCNKLKAILASEDCSCGGDSDTAPHAIVPYSGSGSTTIICSSFNFGYGIGDPSGGSDSDMYLQGVSLTEQWIWRNIGGTWTRLFNMVGAQGLPGVAGADGANGKTIVSAWGPIATSAGTLETTFDVQYIDTSESQDCAYYCANVILGLNDNGKTIKLYLGDTIILQYFTDKLISEDNKCIKMEAWVTNVEDASVIVETAINGTLPTAAPVALIAKDNSFTLTGQNSIASAGDISWLNTRIEYLNHITRV